MKSFSLLAIFFLSTHSAVDAAANAVDSGVQQGKTHPIDKVINMLEGLKAKSIMEGKKEGESYNKFAYWCSTSIDTLKDAIADEKEKIAELEDLLEGKNKEKEGLEKEIETLEEQIAEMEATAKKAKDIRKDEAKLYSKTASDLKKTIQAVDDALKALSSAEGKTEPGMLLAQGHVRKMLALISLKSVTENQLNELKTFADQPKERPKQLAKGDLDAHVDKYDFKSGSVIELLKQLKLKFQDDKMAATKAETNALNAYDLAKKARDNAIKAAEKSKDKKEKTLAKVKSTIAQAEKDLENEEADLKADSKSLADTEEACATKKGEWETRSKVREQEIEAMDVAMKILAKATGVRTEAPGNPVPPPSPVLLQLQSDDNPKMAAVALLRQAAKDTHSKALERLAVEVMAHLKGPFDQVNNMIEKMIFRLMDEQKQEDEHKLWCDQEIEKTNTMKEDKEDKIKDLKAEIKTQTAAVAKLTEEIEAAQEMIADIVSFKKEATEIREVGKKENKLAIEDAETAQKALANAIAVLTDFYKESGEIEKEPWEFIQKPVKLPENPKTWDSPYTGVADPDKQPSGILTVLENVMSDFAKVEAETKSQEAADQKEYDQSMSDHDIEMARRTQESDMKSNEKKTRSQKIVDLQRQKKDTDAELEKTEQYLQDLKPACVDGDSSYDDRKAARAKEIEALKKAQITLQDAFKEKASSFLQLRR
jgi:DNA repair exonuclease SbcCD ATPase subunit